MEMMPRGTEPILGRQHQLRTGAILAYAKLEVPLKMIESIGADDGLPVELVPAIFVAVIFFLFFRIGWDFSQRLVFISLFPANPDIGLDVEGDRPIPKLRRE